MTGKLYLCATPIGNLEDITYRAVRILSEVDLILAEDTRVTLKLLNHFNIKKPLMSYHEHNKHARGPEIINMLKEGKTIALVTDAGMPGISDPGEDIVKLCIDNDIDIEVIPGATASITALVLSGFSTERFVFYGFIPMDSKKKNEVYSLLINETKTSIIYEAPHRIKHTLSELYDKIGNRRVVICRELTKKFEQIYRIELEKAKEIFIDKDPKGEFVIILEGRAKEDIKREEISKWSEISVEEHLKIYLDKGLSKKDAMKLVANERGLTKREIYKYTIEN